MGTILRVQRIALLLQLSAAVGNSGDFCTRIAAMTKVFAISTAERRSFAAACQASAVVVPALWINGGTLHDHGIS